MFAATVEAGKLERALDLVERLHLEKSFQFAMTIADGHRRLVDLIEDAKDRRFAAEDSNDSEEENYRASTKIGFSRISPDSTYRKHQLPSELGDHVRQVRPKNHI
jgi:chromosome transmission fidelity protein 4